MAVQRTMKSGYIREEKSVTRQLVSFRLDGAQVSGFLGESVACAVGALGVTTLRHAPRSGDARGAFCMMGVCQECVCRIDGRRREACRTPLAEGMEVDTIG